MFICCYFLCFIPHMCLWGFSGTFLKARHTWNNLEWKSYVRCYAHSSHQSQGHVSGLFSLLIWIWSRDPATGSGPAEVPSRVREFKPPSSRFVRPRRRLVLSCAAFSISLLGGKSCLSEPVRAAHRDIQMCGGQCGRKELDSRFKSAPAFSSFLNFNHETLNICQKEKPLKQVCGTLKLRIGVIKPFEQCDNFNLIKLTSTGWEHLIMRIIKYLLGCDGRFFWRPLNK